MVIAMMGVNDFDLRTSYKTRFISDKPSFLKSLHIYKLFRITQLHITARIKEIMASKQKNMQFIKNKGKYNSINIYPEYIHRLGWTYMDKGKTPEAKLLFKKVIKLKPNDERGYIGLGWAYLHQNNTTEAEKLFEKAIELNQKNEYGYMGLGCIYKAQGRFLKAETAFKNTIEINPNHEHAITQLGKVYAEQRRFNEAEKLFKKALKIAPNNMNAYAGLETVYLNNNNDELFREYMEKSFQMSRGEYAYITITNYLRLQEILKKRQIILVCVQYPMCNIEPLKKIFKDQRKIIFVDNEKIFKDAVKKDGYKTYFKDMIDIEFGHCTDNGNKLLAGNIANCILKKVFKK